MARKPMEIIALKTTDGDYTYVLQLWHAAFPKTERRTDSLQETVTNCNKLFRNCVLRLDGEPVGLLSYWTFPRFRYIEHFAIDAALRGQGVGGKFLHHFLDMDKSAVVLEVEPPGSTPEALGRINFYRHCGFCLWPTDYTQPPYAPDLPSVPLKLMAWGNISPHHDFNEVRETLYTHVYHVRKRE